MTLADGEAILGGAARDEATGPLTADLERWPDEDELKCGKACNAIEVLQGNAGP